MDDAKLQAYLIDSAVESSARGGKWVYFSN